MSKKIIKLAKIAQPGVPHRSISIIDSVFGEPLSKFTIKDIDIIATANKCNFH